MKTPLLPIIAIAVGGVLAVKGLASVEGFPAALAGAQAFAEGMAKPEAGKDKAKDGEKAGADAGAVALPAAKPPAPVCAPTAAELAKQAGLSPAELQILQSLSARRGALDLRETDLETQIALLAAAEAKLDAKIKAMNGLKTEIKGMLGEADAQKQAEVMRLITVYQAMKPKDAAARMTLLSDEVRLPMAAKMKERALSAILAQMPAPEAKSLTEKLAARFDPRLLAAARAASAAGQPVNAQAPAAPAATAPTPAMAPAAKPAAGSPDPLGAAPTVKPAAKPAPAKAARAPAKRPPAKTARAPAKPTVKPVAKPEAVAEGPKPYNSLPKDPAPAAAKPAATPAAAATN